MTKKGAQRELGSKREVLTIYLELLDKKKNVTLSMYPRIEWTVIINIKKWKSLLHIANSGPEISPPTAENCELLMPSLEQ